MTAVVTICNMALSRIGQAVTISSIDPPEQTEEAQLCAQYWPQVRDMTLSAHAWGFATVRADLGNLTSAYPPTTAFKYTYAYPSDCLRLIGVRVAEPVNDIDFENVDIGAASDGTRLIYSNTKDASAVYIRQVTDSAVYSAQLVEAQVYFLASLLAGGIIKGVEGMRVADAMRERGERDLLKAQTLDKRQSRNSSVQDWTQQKASWLKARGATVRDAPIVRRIGDA